MSHKQITLISASLLSWNQSVLSVRTLVAAELMTNNRVLWLMLSHWARRAVRQVLYCFLIAVIKLLPDDALVGAPVGMLSHAGFAAAVG
mmetsp:Transcript_13757/g.21073  ORF Transcript_13757/g.21073 Transcript_13757/m.21073 type:complete len:89 (+) Transcript_13757:264-530(+)